MRILKSDGFKAKPGLFSLLRSSVWACEIGNGNLLRDLVVVQVYFLKRDDWATRKAIAEALSELVIVERDSLSELMASCLKTFKSRRFDKVNAVREAMTKRLELRKGIPDALEDGSPPLQSQASSKAWLTLNTSQLRRNHPLRRSSPPDIALKTTTRNMASLEDPSKMSSPPLYKKLDFKKPADYIVEHSASHGL